MKKLLFLLSCLFLISCTEYDQVRLLNTGNCVRVREDILFKVGDTVCVEKYTSNYVWMYTNEDIMKDTNIVIGGYTAQYRVGVVKK